jgi:hypothetical protein
MQCLSFFAALALVLGSVQTMMACQNVTSRVQQHWLCPSKQWL